MDILTWDTVSPRSARLIDKQALTDLCETGNLVINVVGWFDCISTSGISIVTPMNSERQGKSSFFDFLLAFFVLTSRPWSTTGVSSYIDIKLCLRAWAKTPSLISRASFFAWNMKLKQSVQLPTRVWPQYQKPSQLTFISSFSVLGARSGTGGES